MNPLIETNDQDIKTWDDWKRAWSIVDQNLFRESLIKTGFRSELLGMSPEERDDRLRFYLQIADGWSRTSDLFFMTEEERERYRMDSKDHGDPATKRRWLARTAFETLCKHVFQFRSGDQVDTSVHFIQRPEVLDTVLDFFLKNRDGTYHNLPSGFTHVDKIAREFLERLIDGFWDGRSHRDDIPRWRSQNVPERRLRLAELMVHADLAHLLLTYNRHQTPDEACFKYMEQIAIEQSCHTKGAPQSLEAAVCLGSRAAQALIIVKIKQQREESVQRSIERARRDEDSCAGR